MRLRELIEDVQGPGVTTAPFLKDGPLRVSKHFTQRLKERDLDLKTVARFISKAIKKNKAEIEALPVDTSFILKSKMGLGVAIVKQETPNGIAYLINTAHPQFSAGPTQKVFLGDSKLLDKPTPTVGQLAEKYKTSLIAVELQLKKGVKVEMEHTKKHSVAKEIALDHLAEDLYYYEKLAKIEKKTNESHPDGCSCSKCNENFADGKGPGRPGDSSRHGIPKGATIAQLEKAAKAKGRKGQLARWQLNMRRGKKKDETIEGIDRVAGGWQHSGFGYRGQSPIYPLPRWNTFMKHNRNPLGSFEDIIHYMVFLIQEYQTANISITGQEIANAICKEEGTNPKEELKKLQVKYKTSKNWNQVLEKFRELEQERRQTSLGN